MLVQTGLRWSGAALGGQLATGIDIITAYRHSHIKTPCNSIFFPFLIYLFIYIYFFTSVTLLTISS